MKPPAARSYVTSRSHVTTCLELIIASLLLLSRETRLAIATIPSPKPNTGSEKQKKTAEGGRKEGGGKKALVLEVEPV